jgi:hypothetical protein
MNEGQFLEAESKIKSLITQMDDEQKEMLWRSLEEEFEVSIMESA